MTTDQRAEALRLAKEAGIYANDTLPMQIDCERLVRLITLARASAAPRAGLGRRKGAHMRKGQTK